MAAPEPTSEVVLFTTPRCRSCKTMRPIVEDVADEFDDVVPLREVDASSDPATARSFGVRGVPTLVALRNDEEVGRLIGMRRRDDVVGFFTATAAGDDVAGGASHTDRALPFLVAAVFGIAAAMTGVGVLWLPAAGSVVLGVVVTIRS